VYRIIHIEHGVYNRNLLFRSINVEFITAAETNNDQTAYQGRIFHRIKITLYIKRVTGSQVWFITCEQL